MSSQIKEKQQQKDNKRDLEADDVFNQQLFRTLAYAGAGFGAGLVASVFLKHRKALSLIGAGTGAAYGASGFMNELNSFNRFKDIANQGQQPQTLKREDFGTKNWDAFMPKQLDLGQQKQRYGGSDNDDDNKGKKSSQQSKPQDNKSNEKQGNEATASRPKTQAKSPSQSQYNSGGEDSQEGRSGKPAPKKESDKSTQQKPSTPSPKESKSQEQQKGESQKNVSKGKEQPKPEPQKNVSQGKEQQKNVGQGKEQQKNVSQGREQQKGEQKNVSQGKEQQRNVSQGKEQQKGEQKNVSQGKEQQRNVSQGREQQRGEQQRNVSQGREQERGKESDRNEIKRPPTKSENLGGGQHLQYFETNPGAGKPAPGDSKYYRGSERPRETDRKVEDSQGRVEQDRHGRSKITGNKMKVEFPPENIAGGQFSGDNLTAHSQVNAVIE